MIAARHGVCGIVTWVVIGMAKLEKVIAGLKTCVVHNPKSCFGCPYDGETYCVDVLMTDAIAVIKRQSTGERWDVPPLLTNGEEPVPEFPREGM